MFACEMFNDLQSKSQRFMFVLSNPQKSRSTQIRTFMKIIDLTLPPKTVEFTILIIFRGGEQTCPKGLGFPYPLGLWLVFLGWKNARKMSTKQMVRIIQSSIIYS